MKMTEAEKFYKEHKDYCNPNPMTGDYVIEPDDLFRIMEDYRQSQVNNSVLGGVIVCSHPKGFVVKNSENDVCMCSKCGEELF